MPSSRRLAPVLAALSVPLLALPAGAVRDGCTPQPFTPGAAAGPGLAEAVWSAHRGGVNLAPQQTLGAFEGAIAYGADQVEVDLRLTADGVFVVAHDDAPGSVGTKPEDRRLVSEMTAAEYARLNAAIGPWTGTEHDPAQYPTLAETLALVGRHKTGLDIEFKDLTLGRERIREVAQQVADAGIMDRTIWQHGADLDLVGYVRSVDPDALFNVNIDPESPPAQLYSQAVTTEYSFGSKLAEFTPDKVAAIHQGCGLALPHSYDGLDDKDPSAAETAKELATMVEGRRAGLDGFQTNRPDAAADALDQPVASRLERQGRVTCLVNAANGLGLPGRQLTVGKRSFTTGKSGCVAAPGGARFDGDGSALAAR